MLTYSFYESDSRVQQYAKALAARGHSVDVISLKRRGQIPRESVNGVNVYRLQRRERTEKGQFNYALKILLFFCRSAVFIAKKHIREPYKLVHVHNVPDFLVFAALFPKLTGAAVILDIHDILPEFYASKFRTTQDSNTFRVLLFCERVSASFANHVIVANHIWRDRLLSRSVAASKCAAICNYPDPNVFVRRPRVRNDKTFIIMYPGTLNWHQGLDIAIKAFARITNQIQNAEFQIYGEGPAKNSLISLTNSLGLDGKVNFRSFVPTEKIAELMAAADVAIVPKRASPFGNEAESTKIQEFMAVGVPVIASRTKITSYYHNESRVRFFEPENAEDLARCILELKENKNGREQLVANASEYITANNWDVKKHEYLALVDSLVMPRAQERDQTLEQHTRPLEPESLTITGSAKGPIVHNNQP